MGKLLFQRFLESEKRKRKLSANQFAAFLDISPQTLSNYLSALKYSEPRNEILQKVADKTNNSVYFLRLILSIGDDEIDMIAFERLRRFYSLPYHLQAEIIGAVETFKQIDSVDQDIK